MPTLARSCDDALEQGALLALSARRCFAADLPVAVHGFHCSLRESVRGECRRGERRKACAPDNTTTAHTHGNKRRNIRGVTSRISPPGGRVRIVRKNSGLARNHHGAILRSPATCRMVRIAARQSYQLCLARRFALSSTQDRRKRSQDRPISHIARGNVVAHSECGGIVVARCECGGIVVHGALGVPAATTSAREFARCVPRRSQKQTRTFMPSSRCRLAARGRHPRS